MGRWRRRLARWARRHRLGPWIALLVALAALAYALAVVTEASRRYGAGGYEPKDLERQRLLERERGMGR